eukprot:CAMPEP_0178429610 /NCGR_PEP_ID=MMETSP0689_2-20121128/30889_1 /TAXON_ID=160604 /ORGANISM="Amphidinium massartii, Strain CS-259" /LENGTH=92 /DNA_ID=CAMNT_0020051433 /DNA_START=638 /DNA_END=916 /DNA_ORIENTATION=-
MRGFETNTQPQQLILSLKILISVAAHVLKKLRFRRVFILALYKNHDGEGQQYKEAAEVAHQEVSTQRHHAKGSKASYQIAYDEVDEVVQGEA